MNHKHDNHHRTHRSRRAVRIAIATAVASLSIGATAIVAVSPVAAAPLEGCHAGEKYRDKLPCRLAAPAATAASSDSPTEDVSFNFEEIKVQY